MKKYLYAVAVSAALVFASCATSENLKENNKNSMETTMSEITIDTVSNVMSKWENNNNPVLPNFYCADPTAVVYEGRLYVIGTNDHQMYKNLKKDEEVNYGYINTLAVMSTDDMANWTFHGEIPVSRIAKWAGNSWAPSIASRVEEDGLTHFYLYFANGGNGIGVLTATSPLGPWKDPVGKALISRGVKGLGKCDWLFDPGVCIDDKGDGYLAFGGGPGHDNCKIVKLGKDMVSLDMETGIVALPATPNHFEANELNYVNGTYVLSYCSAWDIQPAAEMCYMTSKTPLVADSWKNGGSFFKNTGAFGMGYGNNHSHIEKFGDKYYMIYQAHDLHNLFGVKGDCRNINIDVLEMNEADGTIAVCKGTKSGAPQIKKASPFVKTSFATLATGSGFEYNYVTGDPYVTVSAATRDTIGGWTMVKQMDLSKTAEKITVRGKGKGLLYVMVDSNRLADIKPVCEIRFDSDSMTEVTEKLSAIEAGDHNLYFVFSNGLELDWWVME
ncbi:MAG: family 43 glycosylhydrolase [Treponema sp.]|nr:family 43 glycosylhydrolase [Treponema sp.]